MSITKNHECHYVTVLDNPQIVNAGFYCEKTQVSMVTAPSERKALVLSPFQSFSTSLRCCDEKLRPREGVWSSG